MRRLGDSVDWTRERFTMNDGVNRAVSTMFQRLFDDGLIYRAERMVNWSPAMRSVLSDIEVEHREVDGELVSIRYGDSETSVVVATTRVETMLGDIAVAVHPHDERYAHLVGTEVELPLTGRRISDPRRRARPPGVRCRRGPRGWHQDEDVLDTWFSSGLWPFATFGWPEHTRDPEPTTMGLPVDPGAAQRISAVQKLVTELRRFRNEQGLPDARLGW